MKKLEIGKVYKFLKRQNREDTTVFIPEAFDFTVENKILPPLGRIVLDCPIIFTVIDICPHLTLVYTKAYFCYKILVGDKIYTKFIHTDKEDFVEEVC